MFEKYEEDVLWDLMEILKLLIRSCLLEGVKGKIRRLFAQRSHPKSIQCPKSGRGFRLCLASDSDRTPRHEIILPCKLYLYPC